MEIPENGAMTAMPSADISTIGVVTMNAVPSAAVSLLAVTAKMWSVLRGSKHYGNMRNWPEQLWKIPFTEHGKGNPLPRCCKQVSHRDPMKAG